VRQTIRVQLLREPASGRAEPGQIAVSLIYI